MNASRRHLAYARAVQDAYETTLAAEAAASVALDGDTFTLPDIPDATQTRWNGEPCTAVRGTATVRDSGFFSQPWFADLEGQTRRVARVTWQGRTHWLDDEDGTGWAKVTTGRGSPRVGHRSIDVDPDTFQPQPVDGI